VIIGAFGGDDGASVGLVTPGESGLNGSARAAVVVGGAALGDLDA
jgi:hypothetical protein